MLVKVEKREDGEWAVRPATLHEKDMFGGVVDVDCIIIAEWWGYLTWKVPPLVSVEDVASTALYKQADARAWRKFWEIVYQASQAPSPVADIKYACWYRVFYAARTGEDIAFTGGAAN